MAAFHVTAEEFWKMTTAEFDSGYYGYLLINGLLKEDDDPGDYPEWSDVEELMQKYPDDVPLTPTYIFGKPSDSRLP